ncbi:MULTISPECIES: hypothetical protein [unclassified Treponema]|uniref:hypothetical protein n=1 Tax=unclassified Treponema TaxID=2638727 RepID=UPI0025DEB872|nr:MULTISPECIES: hypothetical protein [unclassified Treponema]
METLTLKKEAIDIINELPDSKIQAVVQFAQFILKYDNPAFQMEENKRNTLATLCGSIDDSSFVRPSQPLLSDDAERKII